MAKCTKCKIEKDKSEFSKCEKFIERDCCQCWCKSCAGLAQTNRPLIRRQNELKRKYNLTLDDVEQMRALQNNCCSICEKGFPEMGEKYNDENNIQLKYTSNRRPMPGYQIDHNHKTGEVRGLLCTKCNRGLGQFNDNIVILLRAIKYLDIEGVVS